MTATLTRPSVSAVSQEILDLLPLKVDARNSTEETTAIKGVINLLSRVPQRQRIPTRAEIDAHGYTPYQRDCVLDALNWLEGADQPSPSRMFVNRGR